MRFASLNGCAFCSRGRSIGSGFTLIFIASLLGLWREKNSRLFRSVRAARLTRRPGEPLHQRLARGIQCEAERIAGNPLNESPDQPAKAWGHIARQGNCVAL